MSRPPRGGLPQDDLPQGAVAALDPGRSKCGLVRTDPDRRVIEVARVLPPETAWEQVRAWRQRGEVALVLLGDGTGSDRWRRQLESCLPVQLVDERGTTLAARPRFWQLEPPRGWRALLPAGLRPPPRPLDDVVAQLLLERWLGRPLARACPQIEARTVNT